MKAPPLSKENEFQANATVVELPSGHEIILMSEYQIALREAVSLVTGLNTNEFKPGETTRVLLTPVRK